MFQEGENNDKFNSHPRDRNALPAYLVTHNLWFYSLDLAAALLLLSLAVIEKPAVFKVSRSHTFQKLTDCLLFPFTHQLFSMLYLSFLYLLISTNITL